MKRKKEEQIIGWDVVVSLGSSMWSQDIEVDTWQEAVDMAKAIIDGRDPKIKEGKPGIFFRDESCVVYTKIVPRTRTIYVK